MVEKITPVVGATVGSSLLVKNLNRETEHNIQLVNPDQADPKNGKIPLTNPIGKALEGAEEGDEVKVGPNIFKILKLNTTIVKDSVVNKSNIGAGGDDKLTKIKELKELLDSGALDDDEFKQMKKEILGK